MSIKSTYYLKRSTAERHYVERRLENMRPEIERQAESLKDFDLEVILEAINDDASESGIGFENYIIDDSHPRAE